MNKILKFISLDKRKAGWKHLKYFCDTEYAVSQMRYLQKIPEGNYSNLRKQAEQVRYCILQAEEYFQSAENVSIITKPNLLYYGCASLTKAMLLMLGNGTSSFDYQRKKNLHHHHGLDFFTINENITKNLDTKSFLENLHVKIHKNTKHQPWGHFPLWYQLLIPVPISIKTKTVDNTQSQTVIERSEPYPGCDLRNLESLIEQNFNVLKLMQNMPDLNTDLSAFNVESKLCAGNTTLDYKEFYTEKNGQKTLEKKTETHNFFINNIRNENLKNKLLEFYRKHNPSIKIISDFGLSIHLRLTITRTKENPGAGFYYLDIVEDYFGNKFIIQDPEEYICEVASFYIVLFAFGMYCRYHPDIWVPSISNNIRLKQLVETFLAVVEIKYPIMILDQITKMKHNFE
ncbi:hypothetical protein EHQ23_16930 [Leptospira bourretii]|uniref:YaaC-like Protein n=1 Tax=Leptospira bourretii TaxID=2484962 RepID=A0A4R9IN24_9LEPT|nr:YaaC family protein [Leptospira bourretii]TGK79294.1 hypothetical protein EHQ23_16930 [Leptospira bourretii]TGK92476.1 hypothetical protein EHQ26_08720 [Leptospira bourretii]TGL43056.1 hypothetical protein EHQ45_00530 [Leptospira bourretii]